MPSAYAVLLRVVRRRSHLVLTVLAVRSLRVPVAARFMVVARVDRCALLGISRAREIRPGCACHTVIPASGFLAVQVHAKGRGTLLALVVLVLRAVRVVHLGAVVARALVRVALVVELAREVEVAGAALALVVLVLRAVRVVHLGAVVALALVRVALVVEVPRE